MIEYRRVFIDTAPFIYLLDGEMQYTKTMELIINQLRAENVSMATSVVTIAEYLVIPYRTKNSTQVKDFFSFLTQAQIDVIHANLDIARQAAYLRSKYSGFKGMDALQLAAAYYDHADIFLTNDRQLCQCEEVSCFMVDELCELLGEKSCPRN